MWGGCCCDFDFVGVLYGVCKICIIIFLIVMIILLLDKHIQHL